MRRAKASPSSSRRRELDAAGARLSGGPSLSFDVTSARRLRHCERCFPCLSPTLRPWIADRPLRTLRRSSSYVEELWSPMLRYGLEKAHAKANAICTRVIPATVAEVFLSQAGPRFELELSHSEHHLHSGSECRTGKLGGAVEQRKRATRSDRPRLAWYGAKSLARMPPSEDAGVIRTGLPIEVGSAR